MGGPTSTKGGSVFIIYIHLSLHNNKKKLLSFLHQATFIFREIKIHATSGNYSVCHQTKLMDVYRMFILLSKWHKLLERGNLEGGTVGSCRSSNKRIMGERVEGKGMSSMGGGGGSISLL